jgi:signal transduction histidine kinase
MSFRTRLLLAIAAVALLPLMAIGVLVRNEMDRRFTAQDEARTHALVAATQVALSEASTDIAARLSSLRQALTDDDRFRSALRGSPTDQTYLLDYAARAMQLTGLAMLDIADDSGRILSSGQFRNDYGRVDPTLPESLAAVPGGLAVVDARTPTRTLQVLARTDSFRLGGHRYTLVGGVPVKRVISYLAGDSNYVVTLVNPPNSLVDPKPVATILIPEFDRTGQRPPSPNAQFVIAHRTHDLDALRASVNAWFLWALLIAIAAVLLIARWISARLTAPLTVLAGQTARVDLDHLDVDFATDRDDEIGALSRLLSAMTRRLRLSAVRLRDAERRATVGDLARQVTHDIKNGLAPIRHVLRHLSQVERDAPATLPEVFAERRPTLDASVNYLDALARQYARLTPSLDVRPSDVNAIVQSVAASDPSTITAALAADLPLATADPLVLRRIIENLVANGIEAGGAVTITTQRQDDGDVTLIIADTGRGMTADEVAHAFDDHFTTKADGTGLGLSIVRRLVTDLHGVLRYETGPGAGTRFRVTIPHA